MARGERTVGIELGIGVSCERQRGLANLCGLTSVQQGVIVRLSSAVTFVSDLDRSIAFYSELLGLTCSVRDESAALLVCGEGYELYLRGKHAQPSRVSGSVGLQYLIWSADSVEELERCEEVFKRQSHNVRRENIDGFDIVEGRDPDHLAVMVVFPGPDQAARHAIIPRIYSW